MLELFSQRDRLTLHLFSFEAAATPSGRIFIVGIIKLEKFAPQSDFRLSEGVCELLDLVRLGWKKEQTPLFGVSIQCGWFFSTFANMPSAASSRPDRMNYAVLQHAFRKMHPINLFARFHGNTVGLLTREQQ